MRSGLRKENFRVFDNAREQPLSVFHQEDLPATVGRRHLRAQDHGLDSALDNESDYQDYRNVIIVATREEQMLSVDTLHERAKAFGEKMIELAAAIAAFERTLVTHDRLDDFLKGDDRALSAQALTGLDSFLSLGCTTCHYGPTVGGNSYQKVGVLHPYENTTDFGRMNVTKEEDDKFKFKVPSLRNVALTSPYFHDGKTATLAEAVKKMAYMQLDKQLSATEVENLVAFLNSMSDKKRAGGRR